MKLTLNISVWSLTLILSIFSGCSNDNQQGGLPPGSHFAGSFKLADPKKHSYALELIRDKGIPVEIDEKGSIAYSVENQAVVLGIRRIALYGDSLDPSVFESELLGSDDARKKFYEKTFKENNIPYRLSSINGQLHIVWSQIYGPDVDLIKQKIMEKSIKEAKPRLTNWVP